MPNALLLVSGSQVELPGPTPGISDPICRPCLWASAGSTLDESHVFVFSRFFCIFNIFCLFLKFFFVCFT